jgi:hypothetical protein
MKEKILAEISAFFQKSHDFNGILLARLSKELKTKSRVIKDQISQLVQDGHVNLTFASYAVNPHIKRLPDLPIGDQIKRLKKERLDGICAYPSAAVVQSHGDLSRYSDRPFSLKLAIGEAQLSPYYFDLDVLDRYYRDPRYRFEFHDYCGSIGLTDEHYDSGDVAERDKVFMQTFGIGYSENRERVVVVYLRYLHTLSAEHQQIWNAHAVKSPCTMNGDYARATINGDWPEYYSAYYAFLAEIAEINKLSIIIGKPSLFKAAFENSRPGSFCPMLRPTQRNFDEFIHVMDKLLSENINHDFFKGDIPTERIIARKDGKKDGKEEIERPGSVQLLENWLSTKYSNRSSGWAEFRFD